ILSLSRGNGRTWWSVPLAEAPDPERSLAAVAVGFGLNEVRTTGAAPDMMRTLTSSRGYGRWRPEAALTKDWPLTSRGYWRGIRAKPNSTAPSAWLTCSTSVQG